MRHGRAHVDVVTARLRVRASSVPLAFACLLACVACGAPSSAPPSAPLSNTSPAPPRGSGCTPRTIDELAERPVTEEAVRCLVPGATVRREGNRFTAIIAGRPAPQHLMGELEPGLAMVVEADQGPMIYVHAGEVRTSLGVGVGSTLGELIAAAPGLTCHPIINTRFMACRAPGKRFAFWTRGTGFGPDERDQAKLERHADHVVVWFEHVGPYGDPE